MLSKEKQEGGLLEGRLKIVDATHVIADVAIPNTVNLLRQGRKRVLRRPGRVSRRAMRELDRLKTRFQLVVLSNGMPGFWNTWRRAVYSLILTECFL